MKIFAADDERYSLKQLEQAIREMAPQADVAVFQDPEELLEYASEHSCDVAFLDIEMGAVSGIDVAKQLKFLYPAVNIVFVTAYSQYLQDAFKLHANGYLMKPIKKEEVAEELNALRMPLVLLPKKDMLVAKCFGTFDAFVNGKSLKFERSKTKELLAYLIDRRGNAVTSGDIRAVLWEDSATDKSSGTYFQKIKTDLRKTLKAEGIEHVFLTGRNKYAIDPDKISCDYYDYLADKPEGVRAYNGEYMSQYSWGEVRNVILQDKEKRR